MKMELLARVVSTGRLMGGPCKSALYLGSKLNIFTDSQYAINNIHENGLRLEKQGWIDVANKNILQKIIASLRSRRGDTYFIKVKGHSGDKGNEEADKLAKEGAAKDIADNIDLQIPEDYDVEGAEFIALTQAELYRGIREMKEATLAPRRNTTIWLDIIRWASKDRWGIFPTDKLIWTSIRNPNIDKKKGIPIPINSWIPPDRSILGKNSPI
jgi:hypothetical protein